MIELKTEKITVRGEAFEVREMKGTERFRCADIQEKEGSTGVVGFIVPRCVIAPSNFKSDEHPSVVISTIFNKIGELSGVDDDALEDAGKK